MFLSASIGWCARSRCDGSSLRQPGTSAFSPNPSEPANRPDAVRLTNRKIDSIDRFKAPPADDSNLEYTIQEGFMKIRSLAVAVALSAAAPLLAQPAIPLPDASPKATVSQTIGITNVEIDYHRPAVNKRKIFGGLVSYGA